jgi:Tfp pilus assembly protein PilF
LAEKAHTVNPNETVIMDTLGWIHYKLRNYDQSLQLLERSLSQKPENAITNYHIGTVLYQSGKLDQAKMHLKRAIRSNEDFIGREEATELLGKLS